jgi:hypothetical protein
MSSGARYLHSRIDFIPSRVPKAQRAVSCQPSRYASPSVSTAIPNRIGRESPGQSGWRGSGAASMFLRMLSETDHLRQCRATLWRIWQYMSPPDEPWRDVALKFQKWAEATLDGTGPLTIPNHFREVHSDTAEALRAAVSQLERQGATSDAARRVIEDAQAALMRADALAAVAAEPQVEIAYGTRPDGIDPESLLPDHAGALLREAQLAGALDTIRKAIETIEPGSLPAPTTPREEAKSVIRWIMARLPVERSRRFGAS